MLPPASCGGGPLSAGPAANEEDRFADAYALLRPLADAGHAEAQGIVGSLMMASWHRFNSLAEAISGAGALDGADVEQVAAPSANRALDRAEVRWRQLWE